MDEYPDAVEEFELMYADQLELIRSQEDSEQNHTTYNGDGSSTNEQQSVNKANEECINDSQPIESINVTQNQHNFNSNEHRGSVQENSTKKRTIEELFGDIDDLLFDEKSQCNKKHKNKHEDDLALIEHILELRRLTAERMNPTTAVARHDNIDLYVKDNLSYEVPRYSFETITTYDGKRLYIRCHSEKFLKDKVNKINKQGTFAGCMGEAFKKVWDEAQVILNNQMDSEILGNELSQTEASAETSAQLWTDLYKPQKYFELLSDESTNRILLKWFKLWDKLVFNRRSKLKLRKETDFMNKFGRPEFTMDLDEQGRPEYKIVLLSGPPGLGKTTLAHTVAKHAGYNVVEVNASDDRSTETFKKILENSTQMSSVIDRDHRPNCLIFDEIDGAPASSIEYLIKYVNGAGTKRKKKGSSEKSNVLRRPIICICNDLYVPALRSLRQNAFVVNFPPTSSVRLAERLQEIARKQDIEIYSSALLTLCDKTGNDIRSCLSLMHFFQSLKKPITVSYINETKIGEKDMQKGLFAVWQDIFQIQNSKKSEMENNQSDYSTIMKNRMQKILQVVNAFGDYERLIQGIFENYPALGLKDSSLSGVCKASEWFCFTDIINHQIYTLQNYSLGTYVQYGFVVWHYLFASTMWKKINYPSVAYEVKSKSTKQSRLLEEIIKGMKPGIRAFTSSGPLKMDTLPLLSDILTPSFRPVNIHLYTQQEKDQLRFIVAAMLDYNLNYVQERTTEGNFIYVMDPNIEDIISFPFVKNRRLLPYSIKQLIAREVELEKMRDLDRGKTENYQKNTEKSPVLPNHLQILKVKTAKATIPKLVSKDFFGRTITQSSTSKAGVDPKHDLWYQYKEGYNNAVRKRIKVSSLK